MIWYHGYLGAVIDMKTRVIKIADRFYPQYRFCLIWFNFTYIEYVLGCSGPIENDRHFGTMREAINFCNKQKEEKQKIKEKHIMNIVWRDH